MCKCEIVWVKSKNALKLGTKLSFSQSVYYVGEYEGQVLLELLLSVPAPFDFTVNVSAISFNLSSELHM